LERPSGPRATPTQIAEKTERSVAQKLVAEHFGRPIQQLADVQERKWPRTVIGCNPAMSIAIEFPLDCARRALKALQILCGLFENSGNQLSLPRFGDTIFSRFHPVDLVCHSFLKLCGIDISENFGGLFRNPALLSLRSTKEKRQGQESDQKTE
jgi:hypothetical protein